MQYAKLPKKMFKFVTILLCLGSALASDQDTYNMLVDETLFLATQLMVEYKLDTLPLPASSQTFDNQQFGAFSNVTGTLEIGVGTVVNATGIHRNGDANISLVGEDKMVINVNISTDPLIATYEEFNVNFSSPFPFSSSGGMHVEVDGNEITLQATFQKASGVCKLTVDSAELTTLGSMGFHTIPDDWLAELNDIDLVGYMNFETDTVKATVNMYILGILQGAIDKVNPCQYLPF